MNLLFDGKRPGHGGSAKRSVPAVLAAERAGVGPRGHPAELRMWPLLVVITPPGLQYGTGLRQRFEQRLVQLLVAQPAVEAFDEAVLPVLPRFAGRDVMSADASLIRPGTGKVGNVPAVRMAAIISRLSMRRIHGSDLCKLTRMRLPVLGLSPNALRSLHLG